jgi:hypothetical protein
MKTDILTEPEKTGLIENVKFGNIEKEIRRLLKKYSLKLIDTEFASRSLNDEVAGNLKNQN